MSTVITIGKEMEEGLASDSYVHYLKLEVVFVRAISLVLYLSVVVR